MYKVLTEEKILEFKAIWEKREGRELPYDYVKERVDLITEFLYDLCHKVIREKLSEY